MCGNILNTIINNVDCCSCIYTKEIKLIICQRAVIRWNTLVDTLQTKMLNLDMSIQNLVSAIVFIFKI